jgi:hypothetical protein
MKIYNKKNKLKTMIRIILTLVAVLILMIITKTSNFENGNIAVDAFGIFIAIYSLFLIDTISQIFSGVPNRKVAYRMSYYHSPVVSFYNHNIIGTVIPGFILFSIMSWYFALPLYFILVQIIFLCSKRLFDSNIKIFKTIILRPQIFNTLLIIFLMIFINLKYVKNY